jgi:hypothetical protein
VTVSLAAVALVCLGGLGVRSEIRALRGFESNPRAAENSASFTRVLKTAATASAVVEHHAFVQNIRRCFYDANADVLPQLRVKQVSAP